MGPEETLVTFASGSLPDAPASNPAVPTASRAAKPAKAVRGEILEATFVRAYGGGHVLAARPAPFTGVTLRAPSAWGRCGIDVPESCHPSALQLAHSAALR
jgi:hypothetical protein